MNIEEEFDEGIFSTDEASKGMKDAASTFGIDPETVDIEKPERILYARKSCRSCYGRGVISFVPSPAKPKKMLVSPTLEFANKQYNRRRKRVGGEIKMLPTPKKERSYIELEGNELIEILNTSMPEPPELKERMLQYRPCKCLRIVEL